MRFIPVGHAQRARGEEGDRVRLLDRLALVLLHVRILVDGDQTVVELVGDQALLRAVDIDRVGLQRRGRVVRRLGRGVGIIVFVQVALVLPVGQDERGLVR